MNNPLPFLSQAAEFEGEISTQAGKRNLLIKKLQALKDSWCEVTEEDVISISAEVGYDLAGRSEVIEILKQIF